MPEKDSTLDVWKQVVSNRKGEAFRKRLAWSNVKSGLSKVQGAFLQDVVSKKRERSPISKHNILSSSTFQFIDGPQRHCSPKSGHGNWLANEEHLEPFVDLLIPVTQNARQRVEKGVSQINESLRGEAWASFKQKLVSCLVKALDKLLYEKFVAYRAIAYRRREEQSIAAAAHELLYRAFITSMRGGKLQSLFGNSPVAARLCTQITDFWVEATSEFIQRLAADRSALEQTFNDGNPLGEVLDVETGMSDPHDGGRSVIIVEFACGKKIVYKPRPLHVEAFYAKFLAWLEAYGTMHPLRRLKLVKRPGHGWIEFAEHQPCENEGEAKRFYQRCGMLLCIAYAFNGTDFHRENLIACGEQPILIDMEGLLRPHFDLEERLPTQDLVPRPAKRRFLRSVLNTRMLPMLKTASSGYAADTSSLGSGHQPTIEVKQWANVNQDDMRPHKRTVVKDEPCPHVLYREDGEPTHASDYLDEIAEGFKHTYELLREHRGELLRANGLLSGVKGKPVRFILRNTSLYTTLIERCLHPRYLRNEVDRFIQLDVLTRPLLALDERPAIWPAVAAEREALDQLDVPLFETQADSTALTLPSGEEIPDCFSRSAYDEVCERLRALDDEELAFQATAIREVFRVNDARGLRARAVASEEGGGGRHAQPQEQRAPVTLAEPRELCKAAEREARRVAGALIERGVRGSDGSLSWVGANYLASARRHAAGPSKMNLFDGYSGIALLFAALARVTGESRFEELALASLKPLRSRLAELEKAVGLRHSVNIGGATGLGSVVYALTQAGGLLDDPALLDDARQVAQLLDPDEVDHNGAFDVVSGAAGAVLGLLALHNAGGSAQALRFATAWGEHLLEGREEEPETDLRAWPSGQGRGFEMGFAHGQAGIVCALWRLGSVASDARFVEAANEAVAYERRVLGADLAGALADERAAAWSHGATGVGLSRLAGVVASSDSAIQSDLEAALRHAQDNLLEGTDVLCCGAGGRIAFLLAASEELERPVLRSRAQSGGARLCARAHEQEAFQLAWSREVFDTGLFQGSAGVAYALLQAAWPEVLPAVLLSHA